MEWRIYPLDVLFFRGMEAMNAGEASVVHGQFPPSPEVMQGFVRTALLSALGVPFDAYAQAAQGMNDSTTAARQAVALLGTPRAGEDSLGNELGQLALRGPYLVRQRDTNVESWYPAPLDLYKPKETGVWQHEGPGPSIDSDLGPVRFLAPRDGEAAAGKWISREGLDQYLRGEDVPPDRVADANEFYDEEPRVGIARDHSRLASREGMLYAPGFIRLKERGKTGAGPVGIGLRVAGVDADLPRCCAGVHRLGGEGRLVVLEVHDEPPRQATVGADTRCRLILLTPARWGGAWLPPGFRWQAAERHGTIEGHAVTVVAAALGKPVRIGGWDIVNGRPKPAEACVPAGSVFFLETQIGGALGTLHDHTLGARRRAGFGHVVVGRW